MERTETDRICDRVAAVEDKLDDLALLQEGRFREHSELTAKAIEHGELRAVQLLKLFAVIHVLLICVLLVLPYIQRALMVAK